MYRSKTRRFAGTCGCDRYDWLVLREGDNKGVGGWSDCNDEIGGGEIGAQSKKSSRGGCEKRIDIERVEA